MEREGSRLGKDDGENDFREGFVHLASDRVEQLDNKATSRWS